MKLWRHHFVIGAFAVCIVALSVRVIALSVGERDFLQQQGDARSIRSESISAIRGSIYDRNGEPLAVSTPVYAVWTDPSRGSLTDAEIRLVAEELDLSVDWVRNKLAKDANKQFVYLKRGITWVQSQRIKALGIKSLSLGQEFRRYYPIAEAAAHVVGITDIDERGIEGVELAFQKHLVGRPGAKTVLKDRRGNTIRDLEYLQAAQNGKDLYLSIDARLQFIAYRELKSAVQSHKAKSASLIMADVVSGEILALVNQPSYNPNGTGRSAFEMRNRAVTDAFEPGSTVKPFTALAALQTGRYDPQTEIDTAPGFFRVGGKLIQDPVNRATLSLAQALQKSSQVALAKIALDLETDAVFNVLSATGVGDYVGTGLPGEAIGRLSAAELRYPVVQATLAYGYGLSVTPLQLSQAYLVLARGGSKVPLSILRREQPPAAEQIFSLQNAQSVVAMMELVTAREGTAFTAAIPDYRVAGKTGTARVVGEGGYDDQRHLAWFAGMAPATDPQIVMVVMVNEASAGLSGGGSVAAPIFSRVAQRSLRLLGISPDAHSTAAPPAEMAGNSGVKIEVGG